MAHRLRHPRRARHRLSLIQAVIAEMGPMPGAADFLDWLRQRFQVVILSDTFYEFAMPLMAQLGYPTLFCHRLQVSDDDRIVGYTLRQPDSKRAAVQAFHALNYRVVAAGDSYNDTAMLAEADAGILFRPPANVVAEFPQFPVVTDYARAAPRHSALDALGFEWCCAASPVATGATVGYAHQRTAPQIGQDGREDPVMVVEKSQSTRAIGPPCWHFRSGMSFKVLPTSTGHVCPVIPETPDPKGS